MLGARKRRRDMDHRRARPCPVPRRRHGDGDFTTTPCLNLASHGSITYRREAASRGQTAAAHAECSRLVARDHGGSAPRGHASRRYGRTFGDNPNPSSRDLNRRSGRSAERPRSRAGTVPHRVGVFARRQQASTHPVAVPVGAARSRLIGSWRTTAVGAEPGATRAVVVPAGALLLLTSW